MKPYLLSVLAGLLVGVLYGLINVRSPAPPVIALVGLLGILIGEQIVPLAKRLMSPDPVTVGWVKEESVPHVFGSLPVGKSSTLGGLPSGKPVAPQKHEMHG
jgi:XapX domain-containing protein